MHELSIAIEIWQSVKKAIEHHGEVQVHSISIEIGTLTQIEDEQLTFWLKGLAERKGANEVAIKITHIPARFCCQNCRVEFEDASRQEDFTSTGILTVTKCPNCESRELTLIAGNELRVVSAEIESGNDGIEK